MLAPRHAAAIIGAPGAIAIKAPMVPTLAARRDEFTMCRPGRTSGLEDMRPASLRKATTEPVKVTPPIDMLLTQFYRNPALKFTTYQ